MAKVVYTSGTFDLFHVGHLNILKRSQELGDKLIVGVSTDELVCSYKSAPPVVPYKDRLEIIKNLKCVDEVVQQNCLFDYNLMQDLGINIMTIGSDWKEKKNENLEHILNSGDIEVIFFPYTQHVSSTLIKTKIKETSWQEDLKKSW